MGVKTNFLQGWCKYKLLFDGPGEKWRQPDLSKAFISAKSFSPWWVASPTASPDSLLILINIVVAFGSLSFWRDTMLTQRCPSSALGLLTSIINVVPGSNTSVASTLTKPFVLFRSGCHPKYLKPLLVFTKRCQVIHSYPLRGCKDLVSSKPIINFMNHNSLWA